MNGKYKNKNMMIPYKHNTGFVYNNSYYIGYKVPYYESTYIAEHDKIYLPPNTEKSTKIYLKDGSYVEGFGVKNNNVLILCIIILLFYIGYKIFQNTK